MQFTKNYKLSIIILMVSIILFILMVRLKNNLLLGITMFVFYYLYIFLVTRKKFNSNELILRTFTYTIYISALYYFFSSLLFDVGFFGAPITYTFEILILMGLCYAPALLFFKFEFDSLLRFRIVLYIITLISISTIILSNNGELSPFLNYYWLVPVLDTFVLLLAKKLSQSYWEVDIDLTNRYIINLEKRIANLEKNNN